MSGWFGDRRMVLHSLNVVGADKDAEGRFLIAEKPVFRGIDPDEVVVPEETVYFVRGKRLSLAGLMNSTSYGLRGVKVIS